MTKRTALPPIHTALIKAFLPGPAAHLRSIAAQEWGALRIHGENVTIVFDLPDWGARKRAFELAAGLQTFAVPLPGATLSDLKATVRDDVLTVEAMVIHDD